MDKPWFHNPTDTLGNYTPNCDSGESDVFHLEPAAQDDPHDKAADEEGDPESDGEDHAETDADRAWEPAFKGWNEFEERVDDADDGTDEQPLQSALR